MAITGIILILSGQHGADGLGPNPGITWPPVIAGTILLALSLLTGLILGLVFLISAHRQWISQFSPEVQRDIRYLEGIAALGAIDYGLHRMKSSGERYAENTARSQAWAEHWAAQREPPVTFGIPAQGNHQAFTDPAQEMLHRSQRIREANRAWQEDPRNAWNL